MKKFDIIINEVIGIQDKEALAFALKEYLATTYMLYLKTQSFHWNVVGESFNSLHNLFSDQYTEYIDAIDVIAERIRMLGEIAPGSFAEFIELSVISESPGFLRSNEMIAILEQNNEELAEFGRGIIALANDRNDPSTVDMITSRITIHEKNKWMLNSLLK